VLSKLYQSDILEDLSIIKRYKEAGKNSEREPEKKENFP
jgi:hypothetical protein